MNRAGLREVVQEVPSLCNLTERTDDSTVMADDFCAELKDVVSKSLDEAREWDRITQSMTTSEIYDLCHGEQFPCTKEESKVVGWGLSFNHFIQRELICD